MAGERGRVERAAAWVCIWETGLSHYEAVQRKGRQMGAWELPKRVVTARVWDCRDGLRDAVVRLRGELLTRPAPQPEKKEG